MDVYGARSRGPQKYSTDLQLFMIAGIDYDHDVSPAVTISVVTTTATTVSSAVPVTAMITAATTTTAVPIPVTTINYITSIPNYHNVAMHHHPIVNDRLLMFRKLTWIQRVKLQMYEEAWKRKHDPYTPFNMHEIVSWYEMLMFKVAMEEAGELNYQLPVNPPLYYRCTYLFMKPIEQLFIHGTALTLMFPRVLLAENDINISDVREREERIRMAQEDKPWFQFHADLDLFNKLQW